MVDFQALFEHAPGLFLVLRSDLVIVAVTNAYLEATLTKRDAIVGRSIFDVFPDNPEDTGATGVANLRASLHRVRDTLHADPMAVQKYDIRRPDGTFEERYWSPVNVPVLGDDGALAYIIHRVEDVTPVMRLEERSLRLEADLLLRAQQIQTVNEQVRELNADLEARVSERTAALRKAEEKLVQSQKMEAIGRLTGGIAHDFNNMLAVVLTYTSMILERLPATDENRGDLGEVLHAGERAAALTRQLLAFSRQQVTQPRIVDPNGVIADMQKMFRRVIGESVTLRTKLADDVGFVKVDPSQLEQVIANLIVNARDAMPAGGTLTIETSRVRLDAEHPVPVTPGDYVLLAVTDTGIGMDAETRARIFEPFFTTKERGHGTGLGLATVYGIVKQAGGHIWVYSEVGHGSVFKVYLPEHPREGATPHAAVPAVVSAGNECILLVEDERLVRDAVRAVLRRKGYFVLEAESPADALKVFASHQGPIDLLVTDLIMPGMNGRALALAVQKARPSIKVLYMSGYTDHALDETIGADIAFIQKPFLPDRFLLKVRSVLDGED